MSKSDAKESTAFAYNETNQTGIFIFIPSVEIRLRHATYCRVSLNCRTLFCGKTRGTGGNLAPRRRYAGTKYSRVRERAHAITGRQMLLARWNFARAILGSTGCRCIANELAGRIPRDGCRILADAEGFFGRLVTREPERSCTFTP